MEKLCNINCKHISMKDEQLLNKMFKRIVKKKFLMKQKINNLRNKVDEIKDELDSLKQVEHKFETKKIILNNSKQGVLSSLFNIQNLMVSIFNLLMIIILYKYIACSCTLEKFEIHNLIIMSVVLNFICVYRFICDK